MSTNKRAAELFTAWAPVLEAVAINAAAGTPFDLAQEAAELGRDEHELRDTLAELSRVDLIYSDFDEGSEVTDLGKQFLASKGHRFSYDDVHFLAGSIFDLNAREALLGGSSLMVDGFRALMLESPDQAKAYVVEQIVPFAFRRVVDDRMVLQFYAAAVALVARLSYEEAPACVGEEIMVVELITSAEMVLNSNRAEGLITAQEEKDAAESLRGIYDLLGDDDVLNLFEMAEPADTAVAGHTPANVQLGVVDQRPENWFRAFRSHTGGGYFDDPDPQEE